MIAEQPWVRYLGVVEFDVEEGQRVKHMVPSVLTAPMKEKEIAMLAFPDSNSLCDMQGTFKYVFKTNSNLLGYVCFKQKKDARNARGYAQRSFVILSALPLAKFFLHMAELVTFKLSTEEKKCEEQLSILFSQTQQWPRPLPETTLSIRMLDYQIQTQIPNYIPKACFDIKVMAVEQPDAQMHISHIFSQEALLRCGAFQQVSLCEHFNGSFEVLWQLWEATMLNKAVLIYAQNPYTVSHAVLASLSLIDPFVYAGQFSPYTTVYDTNLKRYEVAEGDIIFGATNPLFLRLFGKSKTQIVQLRAGFKCKKTLVPVRDLFENTNNEAQVSISESALRKYFYRMSSNVMKVLEGFLSLQTNVKINQFQDLKFFYCKDFLKWLKGRKILHGIDTLFAGRRLAEAFLQSFIHTKNFDEYLRRKNTVKIL